MSIEFIFPNWPQPENVKAFTTCRVGGVSSGSFASLNLSYSVNDKHEAVIENRKCLQEYLPNEPYWMRQIHSATVRTIDYSVKQPEADASISQTPKQVCVVSTADCLPVLLTATDGREVAAIHAGWRGLAGGIIGNTVKKMKTPVSHILAWLGPAICQKYFEIGPEVKEQFIQLDPSFKSSFITGIGDRWHADLYQIARIQLQQAGVTACYGGDHCTYQESERFFSYRRDGVESGRMATLIYIT